MDSVWPRFCGIRRPLLGMVIGLVVWYQLRKIARTLADTRPFDPENARRIRIVALALIVWQFVQAAGLGGWIFLRSSLVTEGVVVRPVPELDLGTLFAALVLDLREDQRAAIPPPRALQDRAHRHSRYSLYPCSGAPVDPVGPPP